MANVKFTDLPNLANITAATIVPVVAANVNYTVTAANLQSYVNSTTGNVTANYFIGNGSQLTGIASSYGNANVAAYLPTFTGNLNPNNVNVTGDVTLGNTGFLNVGQASLATGNTVPSVLNITGVGTVAAGNVSATGTVRAANISASGTVTGNTVNAGTVSATGNVTAAFLLGNISAATGGYGNAQVQAVLQTYTGTLTAASISASGNIRGNFFVGNGSQLTGITASFSGNMVGNINANTFNITNANVISANTFTGSGSQLTGIPTSIVAGAGISVNASTGAVTITNNNPTPYANANVASYLLTNTGNIAAGNMSASGTVTGTHLGNGAGLSNIVTSITAGSGISVNASTGAVTITATGGGGGGGSSISNGNTNIRIDTANGNIAANVNTFGNALVFSSTANYPIFQVKGLLLNNSQSGSYNNGLPFDGGIQTVGAGVFAGQTMLSGGIFASGVVSATGGIIAGGQITANNGLVTNGFAVQTQGGNISTAGGNISTTTGQISTTTGGFRANLRTVVQGTAGTAGEIFWDTNYIYVCTSTNTWKRAALTTY